MPHTKTDVIYTCQYVPPELIASCGLNPVRVMPGWAGDRLCGTEFLFSHAIDAIPEDIEPLEALARMALADPMTGSAADRADRICRDILEFGSEAVLISRIPGASHCAMEGAIIGGIVRRKLGISVLEIEAPPVIDAVIPALQNRLEALVETVLQRRRQ